MVYVYEYKMKIEQTSGLIYLDFSYPVTFCGFQLYSIFLGPYVPTGKKRIGEVRWASKFFFKISGHFEEGHLLKKSIEWTP